ncbi:unnamed protein product [Dicrocoelium dendriticum]|nr:unnamed protein product [Dicrocoelium dendriticum]
MQFPYLVSDVDKSILSLLLFDGLLSDVILAQNEGAYHLLGFSTGYFLHDIYHNIRYGHGIRSAEIIVHHIAVIVCFLVVLKYRLLLSYALFGLLMELNSIFLHGRQLLLYFNISPGSKWYQYNLRANIRCRAQKKNPLLAHSFLAHCVRAANRWTAVFYKWL